jgi:conjugative transfer pilus assembly protein TraH
MLALKRQWISLWMILVVIQLNEAAYIKEQSAGHLVGPGIVSRTRNKQIDIINFTPPSIENDFCGNMNFHMGSFSFIDGEEIIRSLGAITSNAKGYAYHLALKAMSPQIASTAETLKSWMNKVSAHNKTSCQWIQDAQKKYFPEKALALGQCSTNRSDKDKDDTKTAEQCGKIEISQSEAEKAQKDNPDSFIYNFNVAWNLLKKSSYNNEIKEFLMSITGTIIYSKDGNRKEAMKTHYSSLLNKEFLEKLTDPANKLNGIYKCKNNEYDSCLNIELKHTTISLEKAILNKLEDMQAKMREDNDEPWSTDQLLLIAKIDLPLIPILAVNAAYNPSFNFISLDQLAKDVMLEMISGYINEGLRNIETALTKKEANDGALPVIESFKKQLIEVKKNLEKYLENLRDRPRRLRELQDQIILVEKIIYSRIPNPL